MIVITVFGIAVSVITASFLTFERNQRLKSAASTLKNDIRFVQSKALSGDKGSAAECTAASTLVGWYVRVFEKAVDDDNPDYEISGDCLTPTGEANFNLKEVNFPKEKIDSIRYDIISP